MVKTLNGLTKRQITGDGRESIRNWGDRQLGLKKQTKTKIKRRKKAERQLIEMVEKY